MRLKLDAIAQSPEHLALYKLTIAGVGFLQSASKRYDFYSHEGDFIGSAPIYRVEAFVAFMKRNFGVARNDYPAYQNEPPALTYGWHDLVEWETVEAWMGDLFNSPITLH
jgi:hypothetical protein